MKLAAFLVTMSFLMIFEMSSFLECGLVLSVAQGYCAVKHVRDSPSRQQQVHHLYNHFVDFELYFKILFQNSYSILYFLSTYQISEQNTFIFILKFPSLLLSGGELLSDKN
jgi:hypothetical protein